MGQGVSGNRSANSHVVELGLKGAQAGFDIAKAFAVSQLGEGHAEELIPTGKCSDAMISPVMLDAFVELVLWNSCEDLGKNGLSRVHWRCPPSMRKGQSLLRSSSRQMAYFL